LSQACEELTATHRELANWREESKRKEAQARAIAPETGDQTGSGSSDGERRALSKVYARLRCQQEFNSQDAASEEPRCQRAQQRLNRAEQKVEHLLIRVNAATPAGCSKEAR
jgi:hypothetical protein